MIYDVRELKEHLIILYLISYKYIEYFLISFMHSFCSFVMLSGSCEFSSLEFSS